MLMYAALDIWSNSVSTKFMSDLPRLQLERLDNLLLPFRIHLVNRLDFSPCPRKAYMITGILKTLLFSPPINAPDHPDRERLARKLTSDRSLDHITVGVLQGNPERRSGSFAPQ